MKRALTLSFVLLIISSLASAENSTAAKSAKLLLDVAFMKRASFMYGQAQTGNFDSGAGMTGLPKMDSYMADVTIGLPIGLRLGYSETFTQNGTATFTNGGSKRAEMYATMLEYGILGTLPIGRVAPYLGGGGLYGTVSVSDPKTRPNDTWLAAFEYEQSSAWGYYLQGGIDLKFSDLFALRLGVEQLNIETTRFSNIQNQALKFQLNKWNAGFVSAF